MKPVHPLELPRDPGRAARLQEELRGLLRHEPLPEIRLVAGTDVCYRREVAWACVVVLTLPELATETSLAVRSPIHAPYRSGLFFLREAPAVAAALDTLYRKPDCLLVDGHGTLHPRGFGLACHLGVLFDIPTVGCARSPGPLAWSMPPDRRGGWTPVHLHGRIVGATLRTRDGVRPVWVSPGHRCDLESAVDLVLRCSRFRVPEPLRRAHQGAGAMARMTGG